MYPVVVPVAALEMAKAEPRSPQFRKLISKRPPPHVVDSGDALDVQDATSADPADVSPPHERRISEPTTSTAASPTLRPETLRPPSTRHASAPEDSTPPNHLSFRRRLPSPSADRLGFSLVHAHPEPLADLIFVHGLGGTSHRTWSWQHDARHFWPSWLPRDADLFPTRIFTFGYNADLAGKGTLSNILDFARELLLQMKTYSSSETDDGALGKASLSHAIPGVACYGPTADAVLLQNPIIFVMHSMGGLVVKKVRQLRQLRLPFLLLR